MQTANGRHPNGPGAELARLERRLRVEPSNVDLLFGRARILDRVGRSEEARDAYVAVLKKDPAHFGALNDLGTLLYKAGLRADARTCYAAAVEKHPENPIGHANLAYTLLKVGDAAAARDHYRKALELDPKNLESHRGLALALDALGEKQAAAEHRAAGFENNCVTTLPYRGTGTPLRLLLLVSTTVGNISTDRFIDDRTFSISKLVVEFYHEEVALPPHDIVFNALGDADVCAASLEKIELLIARTDAPVVNAPGAVRRTGRIENARRLAGIPGVVAARIQAFPRVVLAGPDGAKILENKGFSFPLLVRSFGFHTGYNFVRVERPGDLAAAASPLPGDELMVLDFLDARSADGKVRKYRAMFIDGAIYPLHLAISNDWKVHYFSADMSESPEHRAEDEAFLADMRGTLGPQVMQTLERVRDALGLDYAGIDFSVDSAGRVLVFEANATMVIPVPKLEEQWAYRRAPVDRIIAAAQAMLVERSRTQHGTA